jgi:16S rRNA processing protein RimM
MESINLTEQFVVGIVRGSHGISGEFKVESTSGEYEHFERMEEVTLRGSESSRLFKIEQVKTGGNTLYMKLEGINTPEEAARFNGWEIVVPRKYARPLQKGEWYVEDLKGCSVWWTADGTAPAAFSDENLVGKVTNVLEGGSGYLVEISLSEGCTLLAREVKLTKAGKGRTVYVPFKDQFIGKVDVEHKALQLMHLWILE